MDGEEFWEAAKVIGTFAAIVSVVIVIILAMTGVFGPLFNHVENVNFNSSQQHQGAIVDRFVDDCKQIAQAKSQQEKLALENDINEHAGTVDLDQLSMSDYTRTCVKNAIQDVQNSK